MSESEGPPPILTSHPNAPKWPKVIGIIAIIFSVFSFIGALTSFFTKALLRLQMKTAAPTHGTSMEDIDAFLAKWSWFYLLGAGLAMISGAMLLCAGISCLKGKKICRPLYLTYAILTILYAIFALYITFGAGMANEQINVMFNIQEGEDISGRPEVLSGKIGGMVGGLVGNIFGMVLPIFILAWFTRSKIKRDVETYFS